MISLLSIQGDAIIDSWPPFLKLLFSLVMFAVMLYFWYSFCLSFERAKRSNFHTVGKQDMERWKDTIDIEELTPKQADRVIQALQRNVDREQAEQRTTTTRLGEVQQ